MSRAAAFAIVLLAASCASRAFASPLFELAGDLGGSGGLSARTVPSGSAGAYFNPALLTDVVPRLELGFVVLRSQIRVMLEGRPATRYAVPMGIENARDANRERWPNYPVPTELLQNGRPASSAQGALAARPRQGDGSGRQTFTYELIGFTTKLLRDRFALGFVGLIPNSSFTNLRSFYVDEREQYFSNSLHPELYSDRMTALAIAFGAGVSVAPGLSLGVGATLGLRAVVDAPTYVVDAGRLHDILVDTDADVEISLAPHFGLAYLPLSRLRLAATLHPPNQAELDASFKFLLANGIEQASSIEFVHDYVPLRVGLGLSLDLLQSGDHTLTVAASALYATWSDYVDRHGRTPDGAYAWSNTLSPTAGVRYRSASLSAYVDGRFDPTPVPAQTGRTNYVDNDRLSTALGADYHFSWLGTGFTVGAQLQAHWLYLRKQHKRANDGNPDLVIDEVPDGSAIANQPIAGIEGLQTNNPGWPGFASSGAVLGGAIRVSLAL